MNMYSRSRDAGFSLVELLVTVVLAGIIFAAMTPVFVQALKKSTADNLRVTATNIAQDRIEKARLLNYSDIASVAYLNSTLGTTETVGGKTYTVTYGLDPQAKYKAITVEVKWSDTDYKTTMKTIIMDPVAGSTSSTSGSPSPTPSPSTTTGFYTLTVTVKASDVVTTGTLKGVTVKRIDVTPNVAQTPAVQYPTAVSPVSWSGLAGGPNVIYRVTCYCKPGNQVLTMTADVNLESDYTLYFDTDPGNIFH
jgi:prepilin-type N-terminal cleavage/methylation domain-containing protein